MININTKNQCKYTENAFNEIFLYKWQNSTIIISFFVKFYDAMIK